MARIKDSSKRDVRAAADMIEVVVRTDAAAPRLRHALHRALPVPRGADAELLRQPRRQALLLLRLRQGRRRLPVRHGDREPRLRRRDRVARRALSRAARVRGGIAADRGRASQAASACLPCSSHTTAYFERVLWEGDAGRPVREYLAGRGLGEEISREFRLGLSPGRGLADKAPRGRLHGRRAARRRAHQRPRERLLPLPPHVSARRRPRPCRGLSGTAPARRRSAAGEVRQLARKRAVPQERHPLRPPPGHWTAIAKHERAVVVEGNTDVIALRQAGFEPVVASMGTALTERQLRELGRLTRRPVPVLRRRRSRPGRDPSAAWSSPRRRGSTSGW